MNKRYELTEEQVRTLVQHAFEGGVNSVHTAYHLDDELECVLAALEPLPEQQPQGCEIVKGRAHQWEYGYDPTGRNLRRCANCGGWDNQSVQVCHA